LRQTWETHDRAADPDETRGDGARRTALIADTLNGQRLNDALMTN
jgi:hypothetical protein